MQHIVSVVFTAVILISFSGVVDAAPSASTVVVHVFERKDCTYCQAEKAFLTTFTKGVPNVKVVYHEVTQNKADKELFNKIVEANKLPKVTPVTVIGDTVVQGFDSAKTTGKLFEKLIKNANNSEKDFALETLLANNNFVLSSSIAPGCDSNGETELCVVDAEQAGAGTVSVPFWGAVSTAGFSIIAISALLGFVDGFNPCAMWVLITFLLILSQIKDRKKMAQIAGLFIVAEAVMYNLILNVWYTAWDFIALDRIVTPIVGFVALGGGGLFLYKWWKKRKQSALTCDVTGEQEHSNFMKRMEKIAHAPLTWITAFAIIALAFSVNIIEFACSIGIPQAYTKILELNAPDFMLRQFYLAIYTAMYMLDDVIVFVLAFIGFKQLHAHGAKWSNYSALIGGIALFVLGVLLLLAPNVLVLN